ncbi:MAG: OsmC family protein [Anaerolineales bacterium]
MKAEVQWKGRMSFTGAADTGFEVPLGSSPEVGGDNDGFHPMELMAISLAGCTAMDVISILGKKRQEISDFKVKVTTERSETHPKVFTNAVIEYHVAGKDLSEKAVTRAMELSADSYCPAQAMLGRVLPLKLKYFIYEGENMDSANFSIEGKIR